jgi:hypothetical protein
MKNVLTSGFILNVGKLIRKQTKSIFYANNRPRMAHDDQGSVASSTTPTIVDKNECCCQLFKIIR